MRFVRLFLVVLTGLAFLCLGVIAGLYAYATPERLSSRIAAALERDCGLILTPSAPITVKRLPRLEVKYPRSDVRSETAALSGSIESIVISMSPFAVFAKSPKVDSILIDRPTVQTSFASLDNLFRGQGSPLSITIDTVSVTDGEFRLKDGAVFTKTSAGFSGMTETGASFAISSLVSDPLFSGSITLSGRADWTQGLRHLRIENVQALAKGLVSGRSLELKAESRIVETDAGRLTSSDLKTKLTESDGIRLTAEVPKLNIGTDNASADSLSFSAVFPVGHYQESIRGTASADFGLNSRSIRLSRISAETSRHRADGVSEASGMLTGSLFWNPADASGELRLDGQYLGTPVMIALTRRPGDPQDNRSVLSGSVQLGDVSSITHSSLIRILRKLSAVRADIEVSAALLENPAGLTGFRGRLISATGHLALTDGTASAQTGSFPFRAELEADGHWTVSAHWKDLQPTTPMPPIFTGTTSGSLIFSGNLDKPGQSVRRLTLASSDGLLYGSDLEQVAWIMTEEQPDAFPREAFSEKSSTRFSALRFTILEENGNLTISEGRAEGNGWQADFSGNGSTISASVHFSTSGARGTFEMPVSIAVSSRNLPVWTPDWQKALSSAIAADGELPMTAGRMKDKILRELRNWWSDFDPADMKLPDLKLPEFHLPEFELPEIGLPDWFPKFGNSGAERPAEADRSV